MTAGTVFLLFTVVALAPGTHKWSVNIHVMNVKWRDKVLVILI